MRILRSQYLKYNAQQALDASTATKTTATLTAQTRQDVKSIQTLTQTTHTTVCRSSILPLKDNLKATLQGRNSSIPFNNASELTPVFQTPLSAIEKDKNGNYLDGSGGPLSIKQRRQTVACASGDELLKEQVLKGLKIRLINTPCDRYTRINLVVRFYDEGDIWYTQFYRGYQNVLWLKIPRENGHKKQRWYFKCEVCQKKLCSFSTLKSHLNIHMGFFPHRCEECPKQYPARSTLQRHKKTKHVDVV
ncbi:uncharacterized protein LOC129239407 [Anastrepha obliqua]|uniref:uncharacterized protein LOC129239407 n=1 Tax=Anastrepha obliqua TaxID=95512 RepID=UPI00240A3056|nr:uncharacterized protein LOC129239407 [Anastrepha obliqua]